MAITQELMEQKEMIPSLKKDEYDQLDNIRQTIAKETGISEDSVFKEVELIDHKPREKRINIDMDIDDVFNKFALVVQDMYEIFPKLSVEARTNLCYGSILLARMLSILAGTIEKYLKIHDGVE